MFHVPLVADVPWRSNKQHRTEAYKEHLHKNFIKAGAPRRSSSTSSLVKLTPASPEADSTEAMSSDLFSDVHVMDLHVRTSAGPLCTVRLHSLATVAEAKRVLARRVNVPAQQLRLLQASAVAEGRTGMELDDRATLKSCGAWEGEPVLLTSQAPSLAEIALHELLRRSCDMADKVAAKTALEGRCVRRRADARSGLRSLPGPPETLPPLDRDLDFRKAFAMPILYQTVDVDQSLSARTGMSFENRGIYFAGIGITVNSSTLEIEEVRDGLISQWNVAHGSAPVTVGDRLLTVNGVYDHNLILKKELVKKQPLQLVLSRLNTLPPPSLATWSHEPEVPPGCTEFVLYVAPHTNDANPSASDSEAVAGHISQKQKPAAFRLQWVSESRQSVGLKSSNAVAVTATVGDAEEGVTFSGKWIVRAQRDM